MDNEILEDSESQDEEEIFPNDKVKECAESYQYLVEQRVNYEIMIFDNKTKSIENLLIIFTPDEFKHLTGLEKMKELQKANYLADEFYAAAKEGVFTYQYISEGAKDYFFDDTGKTEEEIKLMKGELPHGAVGKNELLDRLTALESIYDLFKGLKPDEDGNKEYTLEIYQWDKNAHQSDRPQESKIQADFLLEFHSELAIEAQNPFTDFFIVGKENQGKYVGMSIFHSELTRSRDKPEQVQFRRQRNQIERKVNRLEILSIVKKEKGRQDEILFSKDEKTIEKCEKIASHHELKIQQSSVHKNEDADVKKLMKELRDNRKKSNPKEYKKSLRKLSDEKYSDAVLQQLRERLNGVENQFPEKIMQEIAVIDTILSLRELEKLRTQFNSQLTEYFKQREEFFCKLQSEQISNDFCEHILTLIQDQSKQKMNSQIQYLFEEEIEKVKEILEDKSRPTGIKTVHFTNQAPDKINSDGTAVLDTHDSISDVLQEIAHRAWEGIQKLYSKLSPFLSNSITKDKNDNNIKGNHKIEESKQSSDISSDKTEQQIEKEKPNDLPAPLCYHYVEIHEIEKEETISDTTMEDKKTEYQSPKVEIAKQDKSDEKPKLKTDRTDDD